MLGEDAALVEAMVDDVGLDLVGGRLPAPCELVLLAQPGQPGAAIGRHPAHHLRRREVLGLAPDLPDPAIGLPPVAQRGLDLAAEDGPQPIVEPVARLRVQVDRVEHGAPHVVLDLVVRAVADPNRPRPLVARQVVERPLLEHVLAAHPVHHLELVLAAGHVGDEVEEVVGLPVEAQRVEAPQGERRVAQPAVAVVPVALAAGRLGQ